MRYKYEFPAGTPECVKVRSRLRSKYFSIGVSSYFLLSVVTVVLVNTLSNDDFCFILDYSALLKTWPGNENIIRVLEKHKPPQMPICSILFLTTSLSVCGILYFIFRIISETKIAEYYILQSNWGGLLFTVAGLIAFMTGSIASISEVYKHAKYVTLVSSLFQTSVVFTIGIFGPFFLFTEGLAILLVSARSIFGGRNGQKR